MVNPGISYNRSFGEWEAAVACGATLTELLAWERGETFPDWFKAKVLAFYRVTRQIASYVEDARIVKPKGKK